MNREVTDPDSRTWTCAEAYAGLPELEGVAPDREDGRVRVVCTPDGGAQSVRVELESGWEDALSDDDLLRAIAAARTD